jgi:hypothetical protein
VALRARHLITAKDLPANRTQGQVQIWLVENQAYFAMKAATKQVAVKSSHSKGRFSSMSEGRYCSWGIACPSCTPPHAKWK